MASSIEEIIKQFRLGKYVEITKRYNIAPSQLIAVVRSAEGGRELKMLKWGLVPSWAKKPDVGNRMINARAETVNEKPSFRAAFKKRRCIVPASGFYEWKRTKSGKQPYYIRMKDKKPLGIAGLWEIWEGPKEIIESCTLITTGANELVGKLHDRMPVVLSPNDYDKWLDPAIDPKSLKKLLRSFPPQDPPQDPSQEMEAYEVSKDVNDPKNESTRLIKPD